MSIEWTMPVAGWFAGMLVGVLILIREERTKQAKQTTELNKLRETHRNLVSQHDFIVNRLKDTQQQLLEAEKHIKERQAKQREKAVAGWFKQILVNGTAARSATEYRLQEEAAKKQTPPYGLDAHRELNELKKRVTELETAKIDMYRVVRCQYCNKLLHVRGTHKLMMCPNCSTTTSV